MMKKTAIILVLCVQFFCAALVFGQSGVIRELSGTVEIKPAGQTAFVPAKVGDEIAENTIVSTGIRSTALVAAGSTLITVRPLTRLSLAEISSAAGTETINVSLQTGRVRVAVNPPPGTKASMSVRGPSATASVRGTSFEFDTRNLFVDTGTVSFQGSKGGTMLVSAGATSTISGDGKAADPIETAAIALVPKPVSAVLETNTNTSSGVSSPSTVDVTFTLNFD
ncbi:MAG: FecR domain-containing protein [Treponema sp.]|jgi:hypothetical protein|nr:FecR domain-containing protein [Treponema sp.]